MVDTKTTHEAINKNSTTAIPDKNKGLYKNKNISPIV
jgi:hypothetical protein